LVELHGGNSDGLEIVDSSKALKPRSRVRVGARRGLASAVVEVRANR
jgi:hypothetical protein